MACPRLLTKSQYRCHLEKNATQMSPATLSWLTQDGIVRVLARTVQLGARVGALAVQARAINKHMRADLNDLNLIRLEAAL